MIRFPVFASFLGIAVAACGVPESVAPPPPNLVFVLVDDLGWQDLSVALAAEPTGFNRLYRTPHLDRMAAEGLSFTQAYASSPVCTPTRSAILTGLNPARSRITDWTLHVDRDFSRAMPALADPPWRREGVSPGPDLLSERLRSVGYFTILVGKGHFGALGQPGADPHELGFDVSIAGHAPGGPGSYLGERAYGNDPPGNVWAVPDLEKYHGTDVFLTDALTREARAAVVTAVKEQPQRPFLLWFAHYAVHVPLEADARFVQRYRDLGLEEPEARYAALIEGVDDSLGVIWDELEALGVAENTLIVFFSDNGGLSAHARGRTADGTGAHTHNAPLRSGKGSAYEGGIRVPLLACWAAPRSPDAPRRVVEPPAGGRCAAPVIAADLYPTLLALAGVTAETVDSQSFLTLLDGGAPAPATRPLAWHYPHKWGPKGPGLEPFTSWRDGDWKLIRLYESERWELYDLANDLGETRDLAAEQPAVLDRLREQLRAWMAETEAQRPLDKASGAMLPIP
ncbi:MAG: sulfatase [Planctomycetota bacterium]|nr:sulfatase [Planctomycetota bacterium]